MAPNLRSFITLAAALLAAVGLYAYAFSSEAAVGALEGRVIADDTGRPLAGIRVGIRPATPLSGEDTFNVETDENGVFRVPRLPVGAYEVQTATSVYQNRPVRTTVQ
ncbi:MAG TPA: carboxypeptidase-like regulatory domain-containing protein, partial [Armatimonadota bacterium]|nr:carboxypeptidase-like regulatory domain-containing protein [Armatimonadota bacterium]